MIRAEKYLEPLEGEEGGELYNGYMMDAELWNLHICLAKTIYAYLMAYRESLPIGIYPVEFESPYEWTKILKEMTDGFREYIERGGERTRKFNRAMNLFNEYFRSLWW